MKINKKVAWFLLLSNPIGWLFLIVALSAIATLIVFVPVIDKIEEERR